LCQTSTSYNATTRRLAAAHSAMVPENAANTVKQE
jgi:hypothetical protein